MTRRFEAVVQRALDSVEGRKHTDGRTLYRAVATTPALDRYGEVVLPRGAILENFIGKNKNPVLLEGHDYSKSSIGHVVDIQVDEAKMVFDFVFSTDTRGQELEQKFIAGDMNAFSIGFKPKAKVDLWMPWDDMPEIKEITVQYPDGTEGKVDLRVYEQVPYTIYNKWELLEISPVSVPANPEALLMRQAEAIIRRAAEMNPVMKSFVQDELALRLGPIMKMLEDFNDSDPTEGMNGHVDCHDVEVKNLTWSASEARTSLAQWASKAGGGKKEGMNWAKFSKGFAEFDVKEVENFGAYKLPHHTVKDGALITVWNGLTVAMAALLNPDSGIVLESKETAYCHLASHYKTLGKTAPELKEYTAEELTAIGSEPFVEGSKAAAPATDDSDADDNADATDAGDAQGDENNGDAKDAAPMPNTIMAGMSQMMTLIQNILDTVMVLVQKNEINTESFEEHFITLQLKTKAIQDGLEYGSKRQAPKHEPPAEPQVVGEVSAELIETLERIKAL